MPRPCHGGAGTGTLADRAGRWAARARAIAERLAPAGGSCRLPRPLSGRPRVAEIDRGAVAVRPAGWH